MAAVTQVDASRVRAPLDAALGSGRPLEPAALIEALKPLFHAPRDSWGDAPDVLADRWRRFEQGAGITESARMQYGGLAEVLGLPRLDLPPLSGVPANLAPFGQGILEHGAPPFLTASTDLTALLGGLKNLSSLHLGNGFLLTNRHVYEALDPDPAARPAGRFIGQRQLPDHGGQLTLCALPERGGYERCAFGQIPFERLGTWNDLALLHRPALLGAPGVRGFRATADVSPGERLWVIGDAHENGQLDISTGTFHSTKGANALAVDMEVAGGFSGGPVFDRDGYVVALLCGGGRAAFGSRADPRWRTCAVLVTTELMAETLRQAHARSPATPTLKV